MTSARRQRWRGQAVRGLFDVGVHVPVALAHEVKGSTLAHARGNAFPGLPFEGLCEGVTYKLRALIEDAPGAESIMPNFALYVPIRGIPTETPCAQVDRTLGPLRAI